MLMTVKLNLHDWPKRGQFARQEVEIEAGDESEAIELGIMAGQQRWPFAKIKAYDVVRPRLMESTAIATTLIGDEAPLVMKRGPGRPRKEA